jgi:hypothetical protein
MVQLELTQDVEERLKKAAEARGDGFAEWLTVELPALEVSA